METDITTLAQKTHADILLKERVEAEPFRYPDPYPACGEDLLFLSDFLKAP
jgi:hypothetical protein